MPSADEILSDAESRYERVNDNLRDGADWFHQREGELFERDEAAEKLADDLDLDDDAARDLVRELVSDDVDPVIQASTHGTKYVGVAEFKEFEGAYGYLDYHDVFGKRRRVICAQCVHEAELDTQVTHATAGDPEGSFGPDANYSELVEGVHNHYNRSHDQIPENVETGASLVSGTTIGGNTAFHAGNDGSGSAIDADTLDGNHASNFTTLTEVNNNADVPNADYANDADTVDGQHASELGASSTQDATSYDGAGGRFSPKTVCGTGETVYIGAPLKELKVSVIGSKGDGVTYADGTGTNNTITDTTKWVPLNPNKVVATVSGSQTMTSERKIKGLHYADLSSHSHNI